MLGSGALLYRWRSGTDAAPLVLDGALRRGPGDRPGWSGDPFSGRVADGSVHGRGAIDDKGSLVAVLRGGGGRCSPTGSPRAATSTSPSATTRRSPGSAPSWRCEALTERGVSPWAVIDEGGAVVQGVFPGVPGADRRHRAGREGAAGRRAEHQRRRGPCLRAAARRRHRPGWPAPSSASTSTPSPPGPTRRCWGSSTPPAGSAALPLRAVFAHAGLLRPLVAAALTRASREANALVRTTVAITQLRGSAGTNVLATSATAHANIRIALGETVESTLSRLRRVVDDPSVELRVVSGNDPSPLSRTDNEAFAAADGGGAGGVPGRGRRAVRDGAGQRRAALRRHQRQRLPVHALRPEPGGAGHAARRRRAAVGGRAAPGGRASTGT